MALETSFAIEMRDICKRFNATLANDGASLALKRGQIHGLIGENGAGKSTLMSILVGLCTQDSGQVLAAGSPLPPGSTRAARAAGIEMVHQHFMLVDEFTVLESIVLGNEQGLTLAPSFKRARVRLQEISETYGLKVDPSSCIGDLPVGTRQKVEILKALYRDAKVLILDEPTAVLTPTESERLFAILRGLADAGTAVVIVTHKLREILDATDRVSIMRRGRMIDSLSTSEASVQYLADAMVGRHVNLARSRKEVNAGAVRLEARSLICDRPDGRPALRGIDLTVRSGEIVGIAGVAGNGQSELLLALSGLLPVAEGIILVDGYDVTKSTPHAIRKRGVAHVPEDRLGMAVVATMSAQHNFILGYQDDPRYGSQLLDEERIEDDTRRAMEAWDVRPAEPASIFSSFSGGNQQKLVVARELARSPTVVIVGELTRGVDVGAIEAIHERILQLREDGKAILLVSSDLEELRALCDRIVVMFEGRVHGELPGNADEQLFGLLMAGISAGALQ